MRYKNISINGTYIEQTTDINYMDIQGCRLGTFYTVYYYNHKNMYEDYIPVWANNTNKHVQNIIVGEYVVLILVYNL